MRFAEDLLADITITGKRLKYAVFVPTGHITPALCFTALAFAWGRLWGINESLPIPLKASTAPALRRLILNMTVLQAVLYGAGKEKTMRCPPK